MWADLLPATTSRSDLYMRRATPVGAPAASSNLHVIGRYVGETWLILHRAAYFTFNKSDEFSEVNTAYQIAFDNGSDRRTSCVHSRFHAQLDKPVSIKKLVLDAENPWATCTPQHFSLYEQISSVVNGVDSDLCSTISFDLLKRSLAGKCADFISSLCRGCVAARNLEFKKEFSTSKSSNNTLCSSPAVGGMQVSVAGGGASAKKASRRKSFIDSAAKFTAHKKQLDDPGAMPVIRTSWMFSRISSYQLPN